MFGPEEEEAVAQCLRSGWVTSGPKVAEFEKRFATLCGTEDAVATSSGTSALHLALWTLDLKPGDEVITPSLTWVSVPNLVTLLGAKPMFCEVSAKTLNIDLDDAARLVGPRTRAIVPVHFAGRPVDMAAVQAFADNYGITVIEDACHAIGAMQDGRPVGGHSSLAAFSFHPNKNISTGEGGMLTGRDREKLALARSLRYHGVTRDTYRRIGSGALPHYDAKVPGLKYIMTDIAASIGLCQLDKLDRFNSRRAAIAARYREGLSALENRVFIPDDAISSGDKHVWHLFNVCVEDREVLRDKVMGDLIEAGIGIGLHYAPTHALTTFQERGWTQPLPVTERIGRTIMSLPLYPGLTDEEIDIIIDRFRDIVIGYS